MRISLVNNEFSRTSQEVQRHVQTRFFFCIHIPGKMKIITMHSGCNIKLKGTPIIKLDGSMRSNSSHSKSFLFQSIGIAIQRGNVLCVRGATGSIYTTLLQQHTSHALIFNLIILLITVCAPL